MENELFHEKTCLLRFETRSLKRLLCLVQLDSPENFDVACVSIILSYKQQQCWMRMLVFACCLHTPPRHHTVTKGFLVKQNLFRSGVKKKWTSEIQNNIICLRSWSMMSVSDEFIYLPILFFSCKLMKKGTVWQMYVSCATSLSCVDAVTWYIYRS